MSTKLVYHISSRNSVAHPEAAASDKVHSAVGNVRRLVAALANTLTRDQERGDQAKRLAKQDVLHSAVASLLHALRDDPSNRADARPRPELDRATASRGALPPRTGTALAGKATGQTADLQLR